MRGDTNYQLKLGVTGGIGSGTSTVCKVFSVLGIPVFSADDEARKLQDNDIDLRRKINDLAGKDLFTSGRLDRAALAELIFRNRELLEKVNSIVHPAVFSYYREWVKKQDTPYSIMEAAILFESGASEMMDRILTVVTPMEERIERVVKGKRLTREQVTERIMNQIDDETRISKSDYVIFNSEKDMIIPAVLGVHKEMLRQYQKHSG